ncbi:MAG: hypothetical protein B7Y86_03395 [Brevundimonas subvibrioides]|uniref:Cyclic nucleotide-binding protein n=1 Tax=Brevundimonas subvibrioides TaxID=74313 RepID=A0A258HP18_9CAUL|nr:DUF1003 domain-containing protein [Brevundimonas subvibrioides]OYX58068.1 MAG: hypothetical protein B7Y86_03395 [Brevundimonas subvibrioides]
MTNDSLDLDHLARRWLGKATTELAEQERRVLNRTAHRKPVSQDVNAAFKSDLTFGERLSDRVARLGGSWGFISSFGLFLLFWAILNLTLGRHAFDPYPFIFLNLLLSMLAAIQAPIIMMSQNRQATKDRLDASHDYEVNLKAEIEIMALHEKLDQMRDSQIQTLITKQQEQIELLTTLLRQNGVSDEPPLGQA